MPPPDGAFRSRLGEAVAIVVSILVAFAIDAGWDTWQERRDEADLLVALQVEFEDNLGLVDEVIEYHSRSIADVATISRLTDADYDTMSVDHASRLVLAMGNPWTFDATLGTTETLIASGGIGLIRDRGLAEMLTEFVNFVDDAQEDADFIRHGAEFLWQQEYRLGGPWFNADVETTSKGELGGLGFIEAAGPDDLRRLWADPLVRGGAKMNQINAAYYVVELRRMREQIEAILARLPGGGGGRP